MTLRSLRNATHSGRSAFVLTLALALAACGGPASTPPDGPAASPTALVSAAPSAATSPPTTTEPAASPPPAAIVEPTPQRADGTDGCALLSPDEIRGLVGQPVMSATPRGGGDSFGCDYVLEPTADSGGVEGTLLVEVRPTAGLPSLADAGFEPQDGIGDVAAWGFGGDLYVIAGDRMITVQLLVPGGSELSPRETILELARRVLAGAG